MSCVTIINYALTLSCFIGLGLSIYAYAVEVAVEDDENYKAFCDIGEHMSCTQVFKSEYGKGFGMAKKYFGQDTVLDKPNSLLGIMFYSMVAIFACYNGSTITKLLKYAIILSNLASIYFASILYFVLQNLCVVCVGTYIVNFVNLLLICAKCSQLEYSTTCAGFSICKKPTGKKAKSN